MGIRLEARRRRPRPFARPLAAWYDVSIVRRLHRTAFSPPPSVDAAVLRLMRRAGLAFRRVVRGPTWAFLTAAFALRSPIRTGLRPTLSSLQVKRLAPDPASGRTARARDLDAEQWARLFAASAR